MTRIRLVASRISALLLLLTCHVSAFSFPSVRNTHRLPAITSSSSSSSLSSLSSSSSSSSRGSFVSGNGRLVARSRKISTRSSTGRRGIMSMAVDRLSEECEAAVAVAFDIGNEIGLQQLNNEILFAGIVARPERALKTLQKNGIETDDARFGAIKTVKSKPGIQLVQGGNPTKTALPFSEETKAVLNRACLIADMLESQAVRSEHLVLALLGYNDGKKIVSSPVVTVLGNMKGIQKGFSVFDLCEELVNVLPMTPLLDSSSNTLVKETVVIGGKGGGSTSTLSEVGVDLTQLALEGKLDPVYGRDSEIRSALRTLGRRRKNNPCLVGDPGVGKTAVAEAIAQVLANGLKDLDALQESKNNKPVLNPLFNLGGGGNKQKEKEKSGRETAVGATPEYNLPKCPTALMGARLINVDLASLVAGTSNRGDFEKKIKSLITEASNNNVILFIDEIHNLVGLGGNGDGSMNAANLLKPALARGELRVLGATTTPEYRRYIEKDGALERRFQPLEVKEPTWEETVQILSAVMPKYEEYHGVEFTSNALVAAAKLSDRYINDRFLPDKAIDLLDEAASMVKMAEEGESFFVTEDAISEVISQISGIPIGKLDTGEKTRLSRLESELEERIKGQEVAVRAVAKSIRRARSGMRDGKRPVASLLFCGPTGVGKTELCKALASTYYGQEKDMIRIDMSEYMDRFSTSRLVGAPPGYVGYDEGGQLTEAVRRAPHSVVLFDELEKAHEDVLNILLQIMDEGVLTDGKGRKVNFKNTIFVMTSNIGSKDILAAARDAKINIGDAAQVTSDVVKAALEEAMKPELLNRIDEIVVFSPLSYDNLKDIATNLIADAVKRTAADLKIKMTVSDNLPEIITRETMQVSSLYGARPTRRAVQRYLEDPMADVIMSGFIDEGDEVNVNLKDPNGEKRVIQITRMLDGKIKLVDIDEDAGIKSSIDEDLDYQATYGDLPPLGGPPKRGTDSFQ